MNPHVKNLGAFLDNTLSMEQHISHLCRSAYLAMRQIASIRRNLTEKNCPAAPLSSWYIRFTSCAHPVCILFTPYVDHVYIKCTSSLHPAVRTVLDPQQLPPHPFQGQSCYKGGRYILFLSCLYPVYILLSTVSWTHNSVALTQCRASPATKGNGHPPVYVLHFRFVFPCFVLGL